MILHNDMHAIRDDAAPDLFQCYSRLRTRFRPRMAQASRDNAVLTFTLDDSHPHDNPYLARTVYENDIGEKFSALDRLSDVVRVSCSRFEPESDALSGNELQTKSSDSECGYPVDSSIFFNFFGTKWMGGEACHSIFRRTSF